MNSLTNLLHDLRFTLRQYRRQPGFALTAVSVLALGIGGSTAVFSVLYQILLKPLPYPNAHQLLFVHNVFPKSQVSAAGVSAFDYAEIRRRTDLFADAGIFYWNDLTLTGLGNARHLDVVNASASLFSVFGVKPRLGRIFSESEDRYGAAGTAVLSDGLWRSAFGSDPSVLGRIIRLNGMPYAVVGVMPREFQFPSSETQLWIPTALRPGEFTLIGGRSEKWLHMAARLRTGIDMQTAVAALHGLSSQVAKIFPPLYPEKDGWHFEVRPIAEEQTDAIRHWLYLTFGAALSVLLIACINVSGLVLIRGTARSGEMAVRRAIGATRDRIAGQIFTETAVLAIAGCACGLLLSALALQFVNRYGPLPQPVSIHPEALIFAIALAMVSTIIVGLAPATFTAELPVDQVLRRGGTRSSTRSNALRYGIVAAQIAFAVALIFTAVQLNRSFLNLTRQPAGFDASRVWSASLTLPSSHYTQAGSWNSKFFEPLLANLRALPGVRSASGANAIPFNPSGTWTERFRLPERPNINPQPEAQISLAFPGYFETMGIPLRAGRDFTDRDRAGAPPVAVIDEELARRYFRDEEPIGRLIASGGAGTPARIVGVVGSVHNSSLGGPPQPEVYYPEFQERTEAAYLVLGTNSDVDPSAGVREAIARLDRDVALFDVDWMDNRVAASLNLRRFIAFLLNGLAIMGLALAVVGLYASLAHMVELRRREIGIRMALGAVRAQVIRMILTRAAFVVSLGLLAGVVASTIANRAIRAQLFGVQVTDAETWAGVLSSIAIAAAIAAWFPAWRAARIEPSVALRSE